MIDSIVLIMGECASTSKHLALFNNLGQELLTSYSSIGVRDSSEVDVMDIREGLRIFKGCFRASSIIEVIDTMVLSGLSVGSTVEL